MATPSNHDFLDLFAAATVMTVWAHPDDESFLAGGLISAANDRDARVINVSATLGELGTDDPGAWPPSRLGPRRHGELQRALDELGGAELETLGLRDGSCVELDDRMGARLVATVLDRHRPDVIVTFGPDGVTGHPDHQAIGRWTDLAAATADRTVPVLHAVTASVWPTDLLAPMAEAGAFFPGYPDRATDPGDRRLTLAGPVLDRKLAALDRHESQLGPLRDGLGPDGFRRLFATEAYRPANAAAHRALAGRRYVAPLAA